MDRPLRIAVLAGMFPVASETFVLDHVADLHARGHEVTVLVRGVPDAARIHERYDPELWIPKTLTLSRAAYRPGVRGRIDRALAAARAPTTLHRALWQGCPPRDAFLLATLSEPLAFARRQPFDILHCHFGPQGAYGVLLNRVLGVARRVVTTFHGFDVHTHAAQRRTEYARLFRHGDAFTANTRFTATRVEALGCPGERIRIWPMGIRVATFPFRLRTAPQGRPTRIVSVARLVYKKGIDVVIRALGRLRDVTPHGFEYHVVGGGTEEETRSLRRLARETGVGDRVHLHGSRSDREVRAFLDAADLFVLASRTAPNGDMEGQAVAIQEAQACGLPVVSTHHNGIPEGVLEGVSAILVPENDPEALAAALGGLRRRPETWAEMGREGRAFVQQHYDASVTERRLETIYAEVIPGTHLRAENPSRSRV